MRKPKFNISSSIIQFSGSRLLAITTKYEINNKKDRANIAIAEGIVPRLLRDIVMNKISLHSDIVHPRLS